MKEDNLHTADHIHQLYQNTQFLAAVQSDFNPNNYEINVQEMNNLQPYYNHYTIDDELTRHETININFFQLNRH